MADGRKNNGGKRRGAGRKPKADEQTLIERLSPLEDVAYEQLEIAVKGGEQWAVKLFFEYRYGKPHQSTSIDANLNHRSDYDDLTDEQLEDDINRIIKAREGRCAKSTKGKPKAPGAK